MSKCSWFRIAPATVAIFVLGVVAARADVRPHPPDPTPPPQRVQGQARVILEVQGVELEGGKMIPGKEFKARVVVKKADKEGKKGLKQGVMQVRVSAVKLSEHWIGLECYPAPEMLRAHVKLPEGRGLVVESVVPESPAAKAGVLKHDILLAAGDKPLGKAMDLIEAVEEAKGKALSLEVLRAGESRKIAVTPTKRPEDAKVGLGIGKFLPPWDMGMPKFFPPKGLPSRVRFRFVHPGTILPGDSPAQPPLPANMKIVIIKEGDKPAKAIVEMGDKKWEVTEKELDKLPGNIRPHVARMLGGAPNLGVEMMEIVPDVVPFPPMPPGPEIRERLEKRFDQMHRHMEQLRKSIEELRDRIRSEEDEVEEDEVEEDEK
jgi:membrane-associated protease RseP (regulator of RpoE activity)